MLIITVTWYIEAYVGQRWLWVMHTNGFCFLFLFLLISCWNVAAWIITEETIASSAMLSMKYASAA